MRFVVFLLVWSGCDKVFGLSDVKSDAADTGGAVDAPVDGLMFGLGCADGTREAMQGQQRIAGCAGGWTTLGIPGSGLRSAAALCDTGWHVCRDAAEATIAGAALGCSMISPGMFFATAQGSDGNDLCNGLGNNDVFGCGHDIGNPLGNCGALMTSLGTMVPQLMLGDWSVGADGSQELANVTKGPNNGGVLCCVD